MVIQRLEKYLEKDKEDARTMRADMIIRLAEKSLETYKEKTTKGWKGFYAYFDTKWRKQRDENINALEKSISEIKKSKEMYYDKMLEKQLTIHLNGEKGTLKFRQAIETLEKTFQYRLQSTSNNRKKHTASSLISDIVKVISKNIQQYKAKGYQDSTLEKRKIKTRKYKKQHVQKQKKQQNNTGNKKQEYSSRKDQIAIIANKHGIQAKKSGPELLWEELREIRENSYKNTLVF